MAARRIARALITLLLVLSMVSTFAGLAATAAVANDETTTCCCPHATAEERSHCPCCRHADGDERCMPIGEASCAQTPCVAPATATANVPLPTASGELVVVAVPVLEDRLTEHRIERPPRAG